MLRFPPAPRPRPTARILQPQDRWTDCTATGALSVVGTGRKLFALMLAHDLEGIVAKRLRDPYGGRTRWLKIKNPDYSQQEGRADLLNGARRRPPQVVEADRA